MSGLRLVGEPELDEVELRARYEAAFVERVSRAEACVDLCLRGEFVDAALEAERSVEKRDECRKWRAWLTERLV